MTFIVKLILFPFQLYKELPFLKRMWERTGLCAVHGDKLLKVQNFIEASSLVLIWWQVSAWWFSKGQRPTIVSPPCSFLCPRDSPTPFTIQSATEGEEGDIIKKEELLPNQDSFWWFPETVWIVVLLCQNRLPWLSLANFLSLIAAGVCPPCNTCVFWDLVLFRARDVIRLKRERDLPVSWNLSVGTCTAVVKTLHCESGLWNSCHYVKCGQEEGATAREA